MAAGTETRLATRPMSGPPAICPNGIHLAGHGQHGGAHVRIEALVDPGVCQRADQVAQGRDQQVNTPGSGPARATRQTATKEAAIPMVMPNIRRPIRGGRDASNRFSTSAVAAMDRSTLAARSRPKKAMSLLPNNNRQGKMSEQVFHPQPVEAFTVQAVEQSHRPGWSPGAGAGARSAGQGGKSGASAGRNCAVPSGAG